MERRIRGQHEVEEAHRDRQPKDDEDERRSAPPPYPPPQAGEGYPPPLGEGINRIPPPLAGEGREGAAVERRDHASTARPLSANRRCGRHWWQSVMRTQIPTSPSTRPAIGSSNVL